MASARPSAFSKGGGGFLNNVDGVLQALTFTNEFPGGEGSAKKKNADFTALWAVITVLEDGADEPRTNSLFAGDADAFEISDDGKVLTPIDDEYAMRLNNPFGRFVASAVEHDFPEDNFPEDELTWEAMVGGRYRFTQVPAMDKDGKSKKRIAKKGKYKGKEFPVTETQISAVHELPDAAPAKGAKGKAPAKGKPAPKAKAKGAKDGLEELAVTTLMTILEDAGGKLLRSRLPAKIAMKLGAKHPQREEAKTRIFNEDFLETQQGWTYDRKSPTQEIVLDTPADDEDDE